MSGGPTKVKERVRTALVIGILAAAGGWAWLNVERVTVTEDVGFRGEARRNPYLAAMHLARGLGINARELRAITDLQYLPPQGVLVLPRQRREIAAGLRARILAWVEGGGHLVIEAEYPGAADPMLDVLAVTRASPLAGGGAPATAINLPGRDRPLRASFLSSQRLAQVPAVAQVLDNQDGTQMASFPRGRGRVTVLTSLAFSRNSEIGRLDHADLFWWILQRPPRSHAILFLNSPSRHSLAPWLLQNAWMVLASAGIALALWLWRVVPRFGPLAPDPIPARRRLLDHLRASGRFHWARQGRARLLEAAREACFTRIVRARPEFTRLSHAERVERLARMTGSSSADADQALRPLPANDAESFTAAIRAMQQVHLRLGGADHPTEKK